MGTDAIGAGMHESPWHLTTPSGQSEFQAFRDEALAPSALVVLVGKTELRSLRRDPLRLPGAG